VALNVGTESEVREVWRRLAKGGVSSLFPIGKRSLHTPLPASLNAQFEPARRDETAQFEPAILIERMAPPGTELLISVRTDAVVPALVLGLGGIWTEALDDIAILPLPATPAQALEALRSLRAAPVLPDPTAAAHLAARLAKCALTQNLALLECNPVIVHPDGAVVVDAIAQEAA
jgi:succinyl-CoA synthetase beta subunit